MIPRLHRLAGRFKDEIENLDRESRRALRSWEAARRSAADQDAYLSATALNLHSFYSGLERLFELVAVRLDGEGPKGEAWHQAILLQMTQERPGVRPPIISVETAQRLDNFRRFRHLIRNVYTWTLNPEKMQDLLGDLPALWGQLKSDLQAFAELLEWLARSDEGASDADHGP